jgi:ATP-dependent DNA helicase RecQ
MVKDIERPLEDYLPLFGHSTFQPFQLEAIGAILADQRPLIVLPTGGGKSLCYQLPALALFREQQALTLVLSPLQALMEDQVLELQDAGLDYATFINANISSVERKRRFQMLRDKQVGLLYISPEQLRSVSTLSLLARRPPACWVIDEAHCISQWGHDFRPDYMYIPKVIRQLVEEGKLPLPRLALTTATATVAVQKDLRDLFEREGFPLGSTLAREPVRENLQHKVIRVDANKDQVLVREVKQALREDGCVIVYTTTRSEAERLAALLLQLDIPCRYYHGKLEKDAKGEVLDAFKSGELRAVTATCAFGMGINRKDVRAVIHHCLSASPECYIQEAGRAGRDGRPADCVLLFRPDDADTILFLQGLTQLREQDLRNVFLAVRSLRDRTHKEALEDWFWATPLEIEQEGPVEEDLRVDPEQRDTRIRVALHHLEEFGMLRRAENLSTSIRFDLVHDNPDASREAVEAFGRVNGLERTHANCLVRLTEAMYVVKAEATDHEQPLPLDHLCDEAGISPRELANRVRELQLAGICTFEIPLTFVLTRGATGDARRKHDALRRLEAELLSALQQLNAEGHEQVNLRGLAARLDPDRSRRIRATFLYDLMDGWARQRWISLRKLTRDILRFRDLRVGDGCFRHKLLGESALRVLYEGMERLPRGRQQLVYDLNRLVGQVGELAGGTSPEELMPVLSWLHDRKVLRISEGLNIFQQAYKLQITKGVQADTVRRRYPKVRAHYDGQTRRTQLMLYYGQLEDPRARQAFIQAYFRLPEREFLQRYELDERELSRPVIARDYDRILGDLNEAQREIVRDGSNALAVVAGPGSGKTRTIVHRIAYLVKVLRVDPGRILALAYNRNAMRQLRLRLQALIGPLAARLRVFTFHGLALALLGRTLGQTNRMDERVFDNLLREACELLEKGEEEEEVPGDTQARRVLLLGNLEYIFVDEYQDVAETEYRLIKLVAGLGEAEDDQRSVHINLCVIGDDDQNIYAFRGTDNRYLLQFEEEYTARRLLLTENYRSTEKIIEAANRLIQNNRTRLKRHAHEQVRINADRTSQQAVPVRAFRFGTAGSQAAWISRQVQSWVQGGVPPASLAILAPRWDDLGPVRLLLEQAGVPTCALNRGPVALLRNRAASLLAEELRGQPNRVWAPSERLEPWVRDVLVNRGLRCADEPTVFALLRLTEDLDAERGFGTEGLALPISADDVLTALYEASQSNEAYRDERSVLVTSCHGAKGLEFPKVVLLTDGFLGSARDEEEERRRLFYVAMTRARDELVMCGTELSRFVTETGVAVEPGQAPTQALPKMMLYRDLTPKDVNLGHHDTRSGQAIIRGLLEGQPLQLRANGYNNGWLVGTAAGQLVGSLSRKCNEQLARDGIRPGGFRFQPGEVTVRAVYRHLKLDDISGRILEDWFVVIPQIRVCR